MSALMKDIEANLALRGYHLSEKASEVLLNTFRMSKERNYDVYTENFLYGLLRSNSIATAIFENLGVNPLSLKRDALISLYQGAAEGWTDYEAPDSYEHNEWLFEHAINFAKKYKRKVIHSSDILCGLVRFSEIERMSGYRGEPGSYFHRLIMNEGLSLNRVKKEIKRLRHFEPYAEHIQYWLTWEKNRFHLQPFSFYNGYNISKYGDPDKGGLFIAKLDLVHELPFITKDQIEELNWLINKSDVSERELQVFFERHPKFLLGVEYKNIRSQLVLTKDSGDTLIPDFFLEKVGTDFCDIVDLKTPNARLISGPKNRRGFSHNLTLALNQLREYRNYFDDSQNRKLFHQKYGVQAFRPTISVIIGRSGEYFTEIERKTIEEEYKNLKVLTYDDIIERAKQQSIDG